MTVTIPTEEPPAGHRVDPQPAIRSPRDFGRDLIQPIEPVRRATELCDVDCAVAEAAQALESFSGELTAENPDPETWPDHFTAETKRIRDRHALNLPDGPLRDRFDEKFDLFAKSKAVDTRALGTHRRISRNREELNRALAGYGDLISRAMNPVTAEFALSQGETAIRNQVGAKVLTEEEGDELSNRYRSIVAERRAEQFLKDDPAGALTEFQKPGGGLFSDLSKPRRRNLAQQADLAAKARALDAKTENARANGRAETGRLIQRDTFLVRFDRNLKDGAATMTDIGDAVATNVLTEEEGRRSAEKLLAVQDRRRSETDRAAQVAASETELLNPDDPSDRQAADTYWAEFVMPVVADLPQDQKADAEDAAARSLGIAPTQLVGTLRAALLSPDPSARVWGARRIAELVEDNEQVFVALLPEEIAFVEAVKPYAEFPLSDGRKVELAEAAVETQKRAGSKVNPTLQDESDTSGHLSDGDTASDRLPTKFELEAAGYAIETDIAQKVRDIHDADTSGNAEGANDLFFALDLSVRQELKRLSESVSGLEIDHFSRDQANEVGDQIAILGKLWKILVKRKKKRGPDHRKPQDPQPGARAPGPLPPDMLRNEVEHQESTGEEKSNKPSIEEIEKRLNVEGDKKSKTWERLVKAFQRIPEEKSRKAVLELVRGGKLSTSKDATNRVSEITRIGTKEDAFKFFRRAVKAASGDNLEIVPGRSSSGDEIELFIAKDETVFLVRETSREGHPTVEVQIKFPEGSPMDNVKVRFKNSGEN